MRAVARSAAAVGQQPLRPPLWLMRPSLMLARIAALALLFEVVHVAASSTPLPQMLELSPFARRMEAEANIVALTCRLLLPQRAPGRRITAIVHSDISGSLEHSLRHSCSSKRRHVPDTRVRINAFGSRIAWRTSLMLKRLGRPVSFAPAARAQQPTTVRVGNCCQPSSDLDELSFPPLCSDCFEEQASVRRSNHHDARLTFHNHSAGAPRSRSFHASCRRVPCRRD